MLFQLDPDTRMLVQVVLALGARPEGARLAELIEAIARPADQVTVALAMLVHAELVTRDRRALTYALAVAPAQICLADVVAAADPDGDGYRCQFGQLGCTRGGRCHPCWTLLEAELAATEALARVTVAELVRGPS